MITGFIPQCKGKDLDDVPKSKLEYEAYFGSIKYDGNYIQIHKTGSSVRFYTSGNHEFYQTMLANELIQNNPELDFIIEAEFIAHTDGKLGDRTSAAKLTTYRTNFSKDLKNLDSLEANDNIKVFNVIQLDQPFTERYKWLTNIYKGGVHTRVVDFYIGDLDRMIELSKAKVNDGFEGFYIVCFNHKYLPGKRVNNAIKLKYRKTVDLLCIDIIGGDGKYTGQIGSLVLQDSKGRQVSVGSGLDDNLRRLSYNSFIGKIIEIEYEQLMDTYIQPTFVSIREDKTESD